MGDMSTDTPFCMFNFFIEYSHFSCKTWKKNKDIFCENMGTFEFVIGIINLELCPFASKPSKSVKESLPLTVVQGDNCVTKAYCIHHSCCDIYLYKQTMLYMIYV